jgi:hypothetical protein
MFWDSRLKGEAFPQRQWGIGLGWSWYMRTSGNVHSPSSGERVLRGLRVALADGIMRALEK